MNIKTLPSVTLGLSVFAIAVPALAHHAFSAEFDADKPLKMTGTVTKLEWQNPHTWFYIDVKDESGNVSSWGLEMASPNLLMRNGWSKSSMKIGDVVIVEAFHAKDGSNNANAKTVTLASTGQTLLTGSSSGRSR
jgi:Family of unknown function (DUF6152)